MEFGGFLVFDIDMIAYCKSDLTQKALFYRKLRSPFTVTAFCSIDEYSSKTRRTKQGSSFMRYLFATETGELFMLAFQLELLETVLDYDPTKKGILDGDIESGFLNVEFLASKLSFCSSLVYLDNSYVFYGSREGDSFILKIWAQH
jgi:hypothetical protein